MITKEIVYNNYTNTIQTTCKYIYVLYIQSIIYIYDINVICTYEIKAYTRYCGTLRQFAMLS